MSLSRALVRLGGWLLTPLVALAASFVGAWLGATVAGSLKSSTTGAWVVVGFGAGFGLFAAWWWLHYLRRHPRLQKTLAVAPDGTPLVAVTDEPAEPSP
ncbi:MAG TPA: hypothetical protein VGQ73_08620 [Gemmatimonadales bacterium]|nr:hypothetical protein [Gemmatimonadales bacterium]